MFASIASTYRRSADSSAAFERAKHCGAATSARASSDRDCCCSLVSGGAIVALADVAAVRPWAEYVPYCVAKSCVVGLVRALAVALAPTVRVNAVAPGPVLFPEGFDPAAREREIARTVLRREGSAADVAAAVAFLAREDYVTGTLLPVDGGRLLT